MATARSGKVNCQATEKGLASNARDAGETEVRDGWTYRVSGCMPAVASYSVPTASLSLQAGWTLVGYWGLEARYVGTPPPAGYFPATVTSGSVWR